MSNSQELAKGLFTGIDKAKERIDSNWERVGHYISRIDRMKVDKNRKGQIGVFVEKTVLLVLDDAEGDGHRVGESITHAIWKHHDSFLGNVKHLVSRVLAVNPSTVTEDMVFQLVGDDQPLAGTVVENRNRLTTTKANKPFTVINYEREVPALELVDLLDDQQQEFFFPDGGLKKLAEDELAELEAAQ